VQSECLGISRPRGGCGQPWPRSGVRGSPIWASAYSARRAQPMYVLRLPAAPVRSRGGCGRRLWKEGPHGTTFLVRRTA